MFPCPQLISSTHAAEDAAVWCFDDSTTSDVGEQIVAGLDRPLLERIIATTPPRFSYSDPQPIPTA